MALVEKAERGNSVSHVIIRYEAISLKEDQTSRSALHSDMHSVEIASFLAVTR